LHRSPTCLSISRSYLFSRGRNVRDVFTCTIIPHGSQSVIPFWGVWFYVLSCLAMFFCSSRVPLYEIYSFPKSWSNTALSFLFHRPIDPVAACTTRIGRLNPNRCTRDHTINSRTKPQKPINFILWTSESQSLYLGPCGSIRTRHIIAFSLQSASDISFNLGSL
jgi:hypothetical protein